MPSKLGLSMNNVVRGRGRGREENETVQLMRVDAHTETLAMT